MAYFPDLVDVIEQFVEVMRQQQRAPFTLRNYRQDLLHFAAWCRLRWEKRQRAG